MINKAILNQFQQQIDKNSDIPIYLQIKRFLVDRIEKNEIKAGEMLPPGVDLCDLLEVSRSPIRNALGELEAEGYITRIQGKGTFVCDEEHRIELAPKSNIIGFIVPNIKTGYAVNLLIGIESELTEMEYNLLLGVTNHNQALESKIIHQFVRAGAKGLVIFPTHHGYQEDEVISRFLKAEGSLLLLDRRPVEGEFSYIGSDNFGGTYTSIRHLSSRGFKNVAFCGANLNISAVAERLSGFKKGAEDYRLIILNEMFRIPLDLEGSDACYDPEAFLNNIDIIKENGPVGICVENDDSAICLQKKLETAGLKIGIDFGIIGYGNLEKANNQTPPLTSVSQNGVLMGRSAAKLIIASLENESKNKTIHIVPTQLVVRESCMLIGDRQ